MTKRIVVGLLSFCATMWLLYTCIGSPAEVAREVTKKTFLYYIVTDSGSCKVTDRVHGEGEVFFESDRIEDCAGWVEAK